MKTLALLILLPISLLRGDYIYKNTFVRTPTKDPRITDVYCDMWGDPGTGLCWGPWVPDGEVWLIRAAGISNKDVGVSEWMMCISVKGPNTNFPENPARPDSRPVVPLVRQTGYAAGTPTLALDHSIVLVAGEGLVSRVNGDVSGGKRIGLRFRAFAFPDDMLPILIGIPAEVRSSTPVLDSTNREIREQEKLLQTLKGQ